MNKRLSGIIVSALVALTAAGCASQTPEQQRAAGEGRDRHCAHVDPVRRREAIHGHGQEREAIEDQRDDGQVEHGAEQVHAQGDEQHQRRAAQRGRQ